jgi:hypothetical protein
VTEERSDRVTGGTYQPDALAPALPTYGDADPGEFVTEFHDPGLLLGIDRIARAALASPRSVGEAMVAAGDSAGQEASRRIATANELAREGRRWHLGAVGEREVATALSGLVALGWELLADRRWRGTRANIDLILVGPGGIFVIDVKNWTRPRVARNRLLDGDADCTDEVDKVLAATDVVASALLPLDVSAAAVTPMLVFAGRSVTGTIRSVRLLGKEAAVTAIGDSPSRLNEAAVRRIAAHLDSEFPAKLTGSVPDPIPNPANVGVIFDLYDHFNAIQERALTGTIEAWMTFLHSEQNALVRRDWGGPARITGAPGTGKTVVALHRSVHLARRTGGPILFVTFVKSLPNVLRNLLLRLDPACADLIEFTNLHKWAFALLSRRGRRMWVNEGLVEQCFNLAWSRCPQRSTLSKVDLDPTYWRAEIDHVIKGRGIVGLDEYLAVDRHGRRTALQNIHRQAVWGLYQGYEQRRKDSGLYDFNDMLSAALAELMREPVDRPYAAVIVDEAQDLSLLAVRLMHALVGDSPNGLMLVGDGRQNVYPHVYRLADAGLTIRGDRAQVLRVNYRNRAAIHAAATQIGQGQFFDDPDGFAIGGDTAVVAMEGGLVEDVEGTVAELGAALIASIRAKDEPGACAVLCANKSTVDYWRGVVREAGYQVQDLEDYDGLPTTLVKVGTIRRAKGLEFKHVFLPGWDVYVANGAAPGTAAADRQRVNRRQAYVGISRARDSLWRGSATTDTTPQRS